MLSFARRVAITLLLPLMLAWIGMHVFVPTMAEELIGELPSPYDARMFGIFALGIAPFLSATWIVELAAIALPPWRDLRRGDPAGRAKLDRASLILGVTFAVMQSFGMAMTLALPLMQRGGALSVPIVTITFVAGSCVLLAAASFITRQGVMNGFVAIVGSGLVVDVITHTNAVFADPKMTLTKLALDAACLAALVGASLVVFREPSGGGGETFEPSGDGPYRGVKRRSIARTIPLPSSGIKPIGTAAALVSWVSIPLRFAWRESAGAYLAVSIVLTLLVAFIFTWLMHRPKAMAALAARFDQAPHDTIVADFERTRAYALFPTFAFLTLLLVVGSMTSFDTVGIVLLVAIAIDLTHALRSARLDPSRVVAWAERHASTLPVLRAALAAEGIASEVRGAAYLSALQIFAPYAPAQILVPREDEARAIAIARHIVLGEEHPAATAALPLMPPLAPAYSLGKRSAVVTFALVIALGANAAEYLVSRAHAIARKASPRSTLAIQWIDDVDDPMAAMPTNEVQKADGIHIQAEKPGGRTTHYVKIDRGSDPTRETPIEEARTFMSTIALPPDTRFELGEMTERDPDSGRSITTGLRSYLVIGKPFIGTEDIVAATAMPASEGSMPYIAIAFSDEGAAQLEVETRHGVGKRLAIMVDGKVTVAPIVKSAIPGGHVSIMLAPDDPETMFAHAKELAERLSP